MLNSNEFFKKSNILYIEPNLEDSNSFLVVLKEIFKEVYIKNNYDEALEIYENKQYKIDFIISTMQLNDDSGIDLLEIIRKENETIPFILTTDSLDLNDLVKAIKFNATDFLVKPLNKESLLNCLEGIYLNIYEDIIKEEAKRNLEDINEVVNQIALVTKTNLDGKIIFANKAYCEISGYSYNELLNKRFDFIKDSNNEILKDLEDTINSGNVWEGKLKSISKNKEDFYVYLSVIPLFDEDTGKIKEFIWIRFLATDYELEQKNFRKKVVQNLNNNRRINIQAREKIDELFNRIKTYQNIDETLVLEKERQDKFISQYAFYKKEVEESEKKLENIVQVAKDKITNIVFSQNKSKKNMMVDEVDFLTQEFEEKNKQMDMLTKELNEQKKIIGNLMNEIERIEVKLGLK